MQLSIEDVDQFFRIHRALMFFVNQRLRVVDQKVPNPGHYAKLSPENRFEVHKALVANPELIDTFVTENPFDLEEPDLDIVRSWKHLVSGAFYAFRQLRNHMIFLSEEGPDVVYGVLALFDPFENLIGSHLPRMIQTTLLPFKGRIIYDGLISAYNVTFGSGIRRRLDDTYKAAKERSAIVTSLPPTSIPPLLTTKPKPKVKKPAAKSPAVKPATLAHDRISSLIGHFCREHLDPEYLELCQRLAGILARKRPSPLISGKPESWACGIVRVIGGVNFLNDPSQPHHMKMSEIDAAFGVSEATGSAKATAIRKIIKLYPMDPEWTLLSLMDQNPMAWMIEVNGMIADVRRLPREIQEEAFLKGLIPYLPSDRDGDPAGK